MTESEGRAQPSEPSRCPKAFLILTMMNLLTFFSKASALFVKITSSTLKVCSPKSNILRFCRLFDVLNPSKIDLIFVYGKI